MRRLFLIAAALAACVCWMVAWPSRQAGLPRQRAAPRRARGLKGAAGLPRASLVRANRTTWRLPSGQCVQRAIVHPTLPCALPPSTHPDAHPRARQKNQSAAGRGPRGGVGNKENNGCVVCGGEKTD